MATYADVIDRCFRDWLTRPDDQPLLMELSGNGGSITASATSFFVDVTLLTPEEEGLIGAGTILEIDSELIRVKAYDDTDGSEQVTDCVRGILGSDPATHDDGAEITISPNIGRQQVFDAIIDTLDDCFPSLYVVDTEQVTTPSITGNNWVEVKDANAIDPIKPAIVDVAGTNVTNETWDYYPVQLVDDFPPATTSEKAWFFQAPQNKTAHVTYKKKAPTPADESDALPDNTWARMLVVGAVSYLVSGEDIDKFDAEYITAVLEMQGVQVGQGQQVSRALRGYYEYLKNQARARLMDRYGVPVKQNGYVVKGG